MDLPKAITCEYPGKVAPPNEPTKFEKSVVAKAVTAVVVIAGPVEIIQDPSYPTAIGKLDSPVDPPYT